VKLAVHQPHYLPWLGYLAKWASADLFVFLDTVQYEKHGWQNRNRIKQGAGVQWLTVPVHGHLGTTIARVEIDAGQRWRERHRRALDHAYARARERGPRRDELDDFYGRPWRRLADVAVASARWLARAFGIGTPWRLASELPAGSDDPTGRLVALCRELGADEYLAGVDGARYLDLARFEAAGITVWHQRYAHPVYAQGHGEFVPFLSAVDLLLNEGDGAPAVLLQGNHWSRTPSVSRLT
jgi:hypothetical protein